MSISYELNEYEAEAYRWYYEALDEGLGTEDAITYAREQSHAFFNDGDVRQSFWDWLLV